MMRTMLERLQETYYIDVASLKCVDCGKPLNVYPTYEVGTNISNEGKVVLIRYPNVLCSRCCIRKAGFSGRLS